MAKATVEELGPVELEQFQKMLKEATDIGIQMQIAKDSITEIAERAKDELDLPKEEFNRYYKFAMETHKIKETLEKAETYYENAIRLGLIKGDDDE